MSAASGQNWKHDFISYILCSSWLQHTHSKLPVPYFDAKIIFICNSIYDRYQLTYKYSGIVMMFSILYISHSYFKNSPHIESLIFTKRPGTHCCTPSDIEIIWCTTKGLYNIYWSTCDTICISLIQFCLVSASLSPFTKAQLHG